MELVWTENKQFLKEIKLLEPNKVNLRKANKVDELELENSEIEEISKIELAKLRKTVEDVSTENEVLRVNNAKNIEELNGIIAVQKKEVSEANVK